MLHFLAQQPALLASLLFAVLFGLFHWWKPSFAYRGEELKPFGVGRRGTTMFTAPVVAVGLAALCYAMALRLLRGK